MPRCADRENPFGVRSVPALGKARDALRGSVVTRDRNRPSGQTRVFGLDAVRASAIALVLISHYGVFVPAWHGYTPRYSIAVLGTLGVDLFFVLSGFLIGRLLIDVVQRAPSFANLRIFLVRRWMRTLPLYIVWLFVSLIVTPPSDGFASHFFRYLVFMQNLAWPMPNSNWFAVSWSLAVEEWFYLLFGTGAILFGIAMRSTKAILIPLAIFIVLPPLLRWQVPDTADWDTGAAKIALLRLDSIAYGVGLAWLRSACPRLFLHPRVCGAIGICLVVVGWASLATGTAIVSAHVRRTFLFNALDVGFVLCIVGAAAWTRPDGLLTNIVRKISDIAYGLYLMDLTVMLAGIGYIAYGLWTVTVGTAVVPIVLSLLSWHFFESRILELRPRQRFDGAAVNAANGDKPEPDRKSVLGT